MTCNVGSAKTVLMVWIAAGLLSLAGTFHIRKLRHDAGGGRRLYLSAPRLRPFDRLSVRMDGIAVARAGSQAALAVGLAIFMNVALGGVLESWHVDSAAAGLHLRINGLTLVALGTIWTVALINCASVATGGRTALVVTIAKVVLVFGVGLRRSCSLREAGRIWPPRDCKGLARELPTAHAAALPASEPPCWEPYGLTMVGTCSAARR